MAPDARRFILWDQDGVLVDSERWYFEATRRELESIGVALSVEEYERLQVAGVSTWEAARRRGVGEAAIESARARRDRVYRAFLRSEPIEVDGVAEVLEDLGRTHRMAIVTTARREDFDLIHEGRGILRHMEFALTLGDYARAKPHPDPYLAALERFGARPGEAVAVEDSLRGLRAARAAGLPCVVVRNRFNAAIAFPDATRVAASVRAIPALVASIAAEAGDGRGAGGEDGGRGPRDGARA